MHAGLGVGVAPLEVADVLFEHRSCALELSQVGERVAQMCREQHPKRSVLGCRLSERPLTGYDRVFEASRLPVAGDQARVDIGKELGPDERVCGSSLEFDDSLRKTARRGGGHPERRAGLGLDVELAFALGTLDESLDVALNRLGVRLEPDAKLEVGEDEFELLARCYVDPVLEILDRDAEPARYVT